MSKKWIKLYPEETFKGSTFVELNYKERYVWWGLLLMAGRSPDEGKIYKRWDTGYKPQELAYELDCPLSVIKSALDRMVNKRPDEDKPKIKILDNGIIEICNWYKYQSEYERQKPYRQSNKSYTKSYTKDSNFDSNKSNTPDIEVDIDTDKEINKEKETYKEKENKGSKSLTPKEKYNYAKGMKVERKYNDEIKKPLLLERMAKQCFKDFYDFGEVCKKQDKPECKVCLPLQAEMKLELNKLNKVPDTYAQCENYILRNCHIKDHGTTNNRKYDFCWNCAWDKAWGENAGKWGNYIIDIKYKKGN